MLSYYLKCRNNTESKNLNALKIKNGRMFLSKSAVWQGKKLKFIKEQEACRL